MRTALCAAARLILNVRRLKSTDFMTRRGDWAKPLLLWAARRYTGMTLREIGAVAGAMDYTAVAMAIKRLEQKAASDVTLRHQMDQVAARM